MKKNGAFVALPEKAFLDEIYFVVRGRTSLDPDEIDLKKMSSKVLRDYSKRFPSNVQDYLKRIKNYCGALRVEVKEGLYSKKAVKEDSLKKEAERIRKLFKPGDFIVALDDHGKAFTSTEFSRFIEGFMVKGGKNLSFVVGGPYGLHPSVIEAANVALSLSKMTMPHEMALLVLTEQVYRAFTIIKGEPYSH